MPNRWVVVVLTGALCVGLSVSPRVVAAQATAEPAGYRELIDNAIAEHEARNFLEARALFARAHAMHGNARTFRGLGMVAFELREYVDSVSMLEQALASKVKPLEGDLRMRTEELLNRARSFVAKVKLVITPRGARVRIDGYAIGVRPSGLSLSVGEHVLEVDASGYESERVSLHVVGGDDRTLTIHLDRAIPTPAQTANASPGFAGGDPRVAQRDEDDDGSVLSSPWFWTTAAVVVAAGVVTTVLVLGAEDQVEEPIPPRSGVRVGALAVDL